LDFEWDEAKSEACFQARGFDFAYAARAFFDPDRVVQADTRHSYGEERFQVMGRIEQRLFGGRWGQVLNLLICVRHGPIRACRRSYMGAALAAPPSPRCLSCRSGGNRD
jgi:uncharacterized DUF497 family protein